jgi:cytochrome P450
MCSHMLSFDPPDHTRLRRLVASAFTNRRIQALRPRIQEITDALLDEVTGVEGVDLMERLAFPLATQVIFELLGVHGADQSRFLELSERAVSGMIPPDELAEVVAEFIAFIRSLIVEKRARPADDLLSAMIAVRDQGDRLSDDELTSTMFLLLIAGQVTTVDLIGNGIYLLLSERSRWEALRADRSLMPGAIEEFLRYEAPVEITGPRMTTEPVDFDGNVIPAGEVVVVGLMPCNRDAGRFADPDDLDLSRADNQHLAFGHGIHYCIGAPLAKLEADIALSSLMDRFPGLDLAEPAESVEWRPTFSIRGPARLPVTGT